MPRSDELPLASRDWWLTSRPESRSRYGFTASAILPIKGSFMISTCVPGILRTSTPSRASDSQPSIMSWPVFKSSLAQKRRYAPVIDFWYVFARGGVIKLFDAAKGPGQRTAHARKDVVKNLPCVNLNLLRRITRLIDHVPELASKTQAAEVLCVPGQFVSNRARA